MDYPEDIDRELIPALDFLNKIPGVETKFSCSGHGNINDFYIYCSVKNYKAIKYLQNLYYTQFLSESERKSAIDFKNEIIAPCVDFKISTWLIFEIYPVESEKNIGIRIAFHKRTA